jgi:hypothetical protein
MQFNQQNNAEILNAIQGTGASTPATTLSTGLASSSMPASPNPLDMNGTYNETVQRLFGQQQQPFSANNFGNVMNMSSRQHTPSVGSNGLNSNMALDNQAILRSLGIG